MIVPNAETIEGATDHLKTLPPAIEADQLKELRAAMGSKYTEEMGAGYLLGLETARSMIRTSTVIALSNVRFDDVANIL